MGIDTTSKKVQINKLVRSQVPSFVAEDNPLFVDFLKQYYIGQEYQGGSIDIATNFNEYQKVENFTENSSLIGFTTCTSDVNSYDATINVSSTEGWPDDYGLLKIDNEIITYTGKTDTSFTGCVRGFCGVDNLHNPVQSESLVFSETSSVKHLNNTKVTNLSNLFLQEFWKKTKTQFLPGFEDRKLHSKVDKANFLRQAKDFYSSKGTEEAIKILFGVLFDSRAEVIKPIEYLFAPSDADYIKTYDMIAEHISGDADNIVGQTLFQRGNMYGIEKDTPTTGSIFNIQYYPRNDRNYYLISLSKDSIVGSFWATGASCLVDSVSIGSTVLTVDSTLGFPDFGTLYVGAGLTVGIATYTSRSSTQFFGVTGISSSYTDTDFVRSSNTIYAYENGDVTKPVYFRLTNIANDANIEDVGFLYPNDVIIPRQLGRVSDQKNYNLNSWIHNIKTKSDVARDIVTGASIINVGQSKITSVTPHLLVANDKVAILDVTEDDSLPDNVHGTVLKVISDTEFTISITSGSLDTSKKYVIRRDLNYAQSYNNQLNISKFSSDIQNTYTSKDNKDVYITTGGLPSYTVYANNRKQTFTDPNVDGPTDVINITNHQFTSGELVRYAPVGIADTSIVGLDTGFTYAVTSLNDDQIALSRSVPDAAVKKFIDIKRFSAGVSTHLHELVPVDLSGKDVKYQNFLRKFPITPEPRDKNVTLQDEPIGMFLNGVEIYANKSADSIHYGPIQHIDVENGGEDYDIITPPNINISDTVGYGATAYPVIEGNFKGIEVVSGGYDLRHVPNVAITGGNGQGATAYARLKATKNARLFDAKINVSKTVGAAGTIQFTTDPLFFTGESITYEKAEGFNDIGGLVDKSVYYVRRVPGHDNWINLFTTREGASSGTNQNGIEITGITTGSHLIQSTVFRNVLDKIVVDSAGSGYSNRRIEVNSEQHPAAAYYEADRLRSGISTSGDYIFHKMHGFESGETIEYRHTGTAISGLTTTQNYKVLKLDEDRFRVVGAGIGTTSTNVDYHKGVYVKLGPNIGVGTHTFKYPDIAVSLETLSGYASTIYSAPVIRPIVRGSITDVFLTDVGVSYGSTDTLNAHRRPLVQISNGSNALVEVGITNGQITGAFVKIAGKGYISPPDLIVQGEGSYGKLLSNVDSDGKLSGITIADSGKGYSNITATPVTVRPPGVGAKFRADLTEWTLTSVARYKQSINQDDDGILVPSQHSEYGLKFTSTYLPRRLRLILEDNINSNFSEYNPANNQTISHSPIVGWAYDGAPIYGPYGYTDPTGQIAGAGFKRLESGYTANLKAGINTTSSPRPSIAEYPLGSFVEDYDYTGNADLDEFNGRFCKTPEFPEGVYAYFCTISASDGSTSPFIQSREPVFPYILNGFNFKKVEMNGLPLSQQNLPILNSGDVLRNTLPYKLGFINSQYDYFVSNSIEDTELDVKTISQSGIGSVDVVAVGQDYKIGDKIVFDNVGSGGNSATAKVKSLVGKGVTEVSYTQTTVDNIVFDYVNGIGVGIGSTPHGLQNGDLVNISGIGTGEFRFLEGPRTIGVASITARIETGIGNSVSTGITPYIYLSDTLGGDDKEDRIKVDDLLVVGHKDDGAEKERVKVLSIDEANSRYRVKREGNGKNVTHQAGTLISVAQSKFTFSVGIDTNLNIIRNNKVVFDPKGSIGIGTTTQVQTVVGIGTTIVVRVKATDGTLLADHDLPPHHGQAGHDGDNSITIPNHGFITGQRLKYEVDEPGIGLTVSKAVGLGNSFSLNDGQYVYAVKKSNDVLGIVTTRTGIGTTSTSLYFTKIWGDIGPTHSFKATNEEHIGFVDRFNVTVFTNTDHTLNTGDQVTVDIAPNTGIGKSIQYDLYSRKTIVDPLYASTTGISLTNSTFTLNNHGFIDGDKVLYSEEGNTSITPLADRGEYYTKRIDKNTFRLFDNRKDSIANETAFINITAIAQAGVYRIAKINPPITVRRGETVGFAVSDSSLSDFELEFYRDKEFTNKFEGVGITTEIVRNSTPGVGATATVYVQITDNLPLPLWYRLTPTKLNSIGVIKRDSQPDRDVINGSKISIVPSTYSGSFGIKTSGISANNQWFTYQVPSQPEKGSYTSSGITTYRYLTTSSNAKGGINEVKVTFPGIDYLKNPGISSIKTSTGRDASVRMYDDTLGRPGFKEISKPGFDYPTDKSLSPRADTPVNVTVENNLVIGEVGVVTAGRNYSTPPDLFFPIRPKAETKVTIEGTSVGSVEILNDSLTGFNEVPNPPRIIPINNTNGVGIKTASTVGDWTNAPNHTTGDWSGGKTIHAQVEINKPLGGWRPAAHPDGTDFPFIVGDEIFVENINIKGEPDFDNSGNETGYTEPIPSNDPRTYLDPTAIAGYNSNMYDYKFFTITSINITDSWIRYSLTGIGSTGGKFDPLNSAGRIIKKEDLPTFSVKFEARDFINGEPISFGNGSAEGQILLNDGWDSSTNSFRLRGLTRTPYTGDVVVGKLSRASGKVVRSSYYERFFELSHQVQREKGFQKDTGKVSHDFQKLQDSDYYQNFSYSIQSEVQEKDWIDAVDSVAHPTGYKSFSDMIVRSLPSSGIGRSTTLTARSPQNATELTVNVDNLASMYVKNDFDFATEETISSGLSKYINYQNKKLTSLLSISTAKVEIIDDIADNFDASTATFLGNHIFLGPNSNVAGGAGITKVTGGTGTLTPMVQKFHSVSNAVYTPANGNMVLTLESGHGLTVGESVKIEKEGLSFLCAMDGNSYRKNYPRSTDPKYDKFIDVTAVSGNNITINVGASPIVNHNVTNATYNPNTGDMVLTIGSHTLKKDTSIKITTGSLIFQCNQDSYGSDHAYPRNTIDNHTAVDADYSPLTGLIDIKTSAAHGMSVGDLVKLDDNSLTFTCDYGNYPHTYVGTATDGENAVQVTGGAQLDVENAWYDGKTGELELAVGSHSLTTSNTVTIDTTSLPFTCDSDGNTAVIYYPRASDPAHNTAIAITKVTATTITVNVGTKADDPKSYPRSTDWISGKWIKVLETPSVDRFVIQVLDVIPSTNTDAHYFVSATSNGIKQQRDRVYNTAVNIKSVTGTTITVNVGKSSNTTTHRWKPSHTATNAIQSGGNYAHTWAGGTTSDVVTSGGTKYNPSTGVLTVVTTQPHSLKNGNTITIADYAMTFSCDRDNFTTSHHYPRPSDPGSTSNSEYNSGVLAIGNTSGSSFEVTVNTPIIGGGIVGLTSFRLTTQSGVVPLFHKGFNPNNTSPAPISIGSSVVRINNHGFQTGERIQYAPADGTYGNNRIGIETTTAVIGGASTTFMPPELYVHTRLDTNRFKISGTDPLLAAGATPLSIRSLGTGNDHAFNTKDPESRVIVEVDSMIQAPLHKKAISVTLDDAVGVGSTTLKLVGISSIKINDLINIDNEYVKITGVGIGSTNVFSINRAQLGSVEAAHLVGAACTMVVGSFRILEDIIHFASPPYGPVGDTGISTNSTFHGRVFNRRDITNNFVFDDISHKFTGTVAAGRTFTLTDNGAAVTGIVTTVAGSGNAPLGGSGEVVNNGIILVNGVFQRPGVDYEMSAVSVNPHPAVGGKIEFTGETLYTLPRGGKVAKTTPQSTNNAGVTINGGFGGGYQPRVAAGATAVINAAGSVQSVTMSTNGSGYMSGSVDVQIDNPLGIGSAAILRATVGTGNSAGMITGITTVSGGSGYSAADFAAGGEQMPVISVSGTKLTINVGFAPVGARYQHTFVTAANNSINIVGGAQVTPTDADYDPTSGDLILTRSAGWSGTSNAGTLTPISGTAYNPSTGILTVKATGHGLVNGNKINIKERSIPFKCDKDGQSTEHYYPRSTDPIFNKWLKITKVDNDTFTVWVGGSTYTGTHVFVPGKSANAIRKATSYVTIDDNSLTFTCDKDDNTTQHTYPRTHSTELPTITVGIATGFTDLVFTGGSGQGFKADAVVGVAGSIIEYYIRDIGFGYKNGDVLTLAGIPTDRNAGAGYADFQLKVTETGDDTFAGWSFGHLLPLDDFSSEFNGVKKSFVLTKTSLTKEIVTLLSFDTSVDVQNNLLIFINDILQQPGANYTLDGGTTVNFIEPPKTGSKLQVLFYRGSNADIESLNPVRTIKVGDRVQLLKDIGVPDQSDRVVSAITEVSQIETPSYGGGGISTNPALVRVSAWKKQVNDLVVDGRPISKDRPNLIGKFHPSTTIIQNVGLTSNVIYCENAFPLFSAYDNRTNNDRIPGFVEILNTQEVVAAHGTATVSAGGTVSGITVTEGGAGYESVPTVAISVPITQTQEIGKTWTQAAIGATSDFYDLSYTQQGVFVATGRFAGIKTSTDGINWANPTVNLVNTVRVNGVDSGDSGIVVVGSGGTIGISTNSGSSFGPSKIFSRTLTGFIQNFTDTNISQNLNAVAVGQYIVPGISTTVPTDKVVAVGAAGTILYSNPVSSGIATAFIIADKFASENFWGVGIGSTDKGTFVAVGNNGAIYRSTNGENWVGVTTTSITDRLNDIAYNWDSTTFMGTWVGVGANGTVIKSMDNGLTWTRVSVGSTIDLKSVTYTDGVWVGAGVSGVVINSNNGIDWYQRHVGAGVTYNALAYGDNKVVTVGTSTSYAYSAFETSAATATATISGGAVNAINVTDGGYGYKTTDAPNVILSHKTVFREKCSNVRVDGDYGNIVGVGTADAANPAAINSRPTVLFALDSAADLNQVAFGGITKSGIAVGDYFVVKGSIVGAGLTAHDKDGNVVGVGSTFADGKYKVEAVITTGTVGGLTASSSVVIVKCNVASIAGIGSTDRVSSTIGLPSGTGIGNTAVGGKLGTYSWSKLYNITRESMPKTFAVNTANGYTGLSTGPTITRVDALGVTYSTLDKNQ